MPALPFSPPCSGKWAVLTRNQELQKITPTASDVWNFIMGSARAGREKADCSSVEIMESPDAGKLGHIQGKSKQHIFMDVIWLLRPGISVLQQALTMGVKLAVLGQFQD
jgi:hypothetical protein